MLRRSGYLAEPVERWLPHTSIRRDLFHLGDVLGVHPTRREFLLVQVTTVDHVAHRLAKARSRPELTAWLRTGGRFEIHGWDGNRLRRVEVTADSLPVVLEVPARRRSKGHRQRTLFEVA